jgi:sodium-dependent dicarboxylate transporter 2/3/5
MAGVIEDKFGYTIEFGKWMLVGVPFAILMLVSCWIVLCFIVYPTKMGNIDGAGGAINQRYQQLGTITYNEIIVMLVFISTALLWVFKGYLPFQIKDSGIAVAAAVVLFLIPRSDKKGFIMSWHGHGENNDMNKMPWGILLLFGGGLSIAGAMDHSNLIQILGNEITSLSSLGVFTIVVICFCVALFVTEVMSNLALITIFLPVLAGIALNMGENPLLFIIGATLASSCAFMLPMATPPNAVVFASGYIKIIDMVKAGILMNIISIMFIILFSYSLISYVFDIEPNTIPEWANLTSNLASID